MRATRTWRARFALHWLTQQVGQVSNRKACRRKAIHKFLTSLVVGVLAALFGVAARPAVAGDMAKLEDKAGDFDAESWSTLFGADQHKRR